jgi:tripartite-type tricarboxylate transporter receptor subunit TctC
MLHVPYKGSGSELTSVLAGTLPLVQSDRLRALGARTTQPLKSPGLPTIAEQNFPGFKAVT